MKRREIKIADHRVGSDCAPFVMAEMSGNHNQSLDQALAIVEAAARSGANAVKLQTYTADTMTLNIDNAEFRIDDPDSLWRGTSLYELYEQAHTPWEWHKPIFKRCAELGLIGFSTPFDTSAVDFLEELNVPAYKVASFENNDLPLIRRIATTGKPLIISTGMATIADLDEAVRTAREGGCRDIILLKCTSTYPALPESSNLNTIPHLADLFDVQVGLSDHTLGIGVAVASVALGATFIEKHFTLKRADGGVDAAFSLEPDEFRGLVVEIERAWQAMGTVSYGSTETERKSLQFRRSLYVSSEMKAGDRFTKKNLRIIRPGFGLAPKHYESLLGRRVKCDVKLGTPTSWDLLE